MAWAKTIEEALERNTLPITESGCWIWMGSLTMAGYGSFSFKGRGLYAHRAAYELHVGPIPKNKFVCHRCDIRCCINPAHLFVGTQKDNMEDAVRKKRMAFGERSGNTRHTEEDIIKMRELHHGGMPFTKIGELYGLEISAARRICIGESWKHLK